MLLMLGGQTAAQVAAGRAACAQTLPTPASAPTPTPTPTAARAASAPRARRPAPAPRRHRHRRPLSPPQAGNTGGLPPDATVEDLLAALGNLSSGSDSDGDFGAAGGGASGGGGGGANNGGGGQKERVVLPCGTVDYYALLQVDDDAPRQAIKRAYRGLARECHPDYRGDQGHNICILLNEAYDTLMDLDRRAAYNAALEAAVSAAQDDYTGKPISKWIPRLKPAFARNADPNESRAVFVDEVSCIGCKQCVWHAPATFRIEPEHGRSRVYAQWLENEGQLQSAVDSCPVSCIHWVERADLPALEHVMQNVLTERVNVGVMMAGQGRVTDVFDATASWLKKRKQREEEAARAAQRQRAYSPAQEAQRAEAAREILRANLGFFAGMFEAATASMDQAVNGSNADASRVGNRRRPGGTGAAWAAEAAAAASNPSSGWSTPGSPASRAGSAASTATGSVDDDWFMVPPERALVPVGLSSRDGGGGGSPSSSPSRAGSSADSDGGGSGSESDGPGGARPRKTAPLKVVGTRAKASFQALFSRR